jgi:spore germination protein KA
MFKELWRKAINNNNEKSSDSAAASKPQEKSPISKDYDDNLKNLRQIFHQCSDIVFHEFVISAEEPIRAFIVYASVISDHKMISEHFLKNALEGAAHLPEGVKLSKINAVEVLKERLISLPEVTEVKDLKELEHKVLQGNAALILEGSAQAIIGCVRGGENRAIAEADTEPGIRGPKDGFVEALDINMSLIRRRLKTSRLKSLIIEKGELTKSKIALCYIEGIADNQLIAEVKSRIDRIDTDSILEGNYLEEQIMDEKFSLFPLIQYSERPDKACASLLSGRIVILVDNSPMPLIVPATFVTMLQAAEDYYHNAVTASLTRLLRFIALNLALLLPAATVAVFSFHQELLPVQLVSTVAGARSGLPLPIALEILMFEFTFELLREAGVRLPKTIGQAISTVGGLVIGQAAVNAGIVSPISVIVIAITAIASFSVPNFEASFALRILRFILIILASFLGGIGIMFGLMAILIHLCSLRSFGVPYLSPLAPIVFRDLKDSLIRAPWWALTKRPRLNRTGDVIRQGGSKGPMKPNKGGSRS